MFKLGSRTRILDFPIDWVDSQSRIFDQYLIFSRLVGWRILNNERILLCRLDVRCFVGHREADCAKSRMVETRRRIKI